MKYSSPCSVLQDRWQNGCVSQAFKIFLINDFVLRQKEREGEEFDFSGYDNNIFQKQVFLSLKPEKHRSSYLYSL